MWERACSRMRWISQQMYRLSPRIREQARSHIWFVCIQIDSLRRNSYRTPIP